MTPRHQQNSINRRLITSVIAVALLTAACDGPIKRPVNEASRKPRTPIPARPAPTASPHVGLPNPRMVNHLDATAVSRAAVQTMWTVDAANDRSQLDAYLRAHPYMTSACYAELKTQPVGTIPSHWRDHHAYARPRLERQSIEAGVGEDTATRAHRQWSVTVTPIGRDGWIGHSARAIVFTTLTRNGDGLWKVSAISTA